MSEQQGVAGRERPVIMTGESVRAILDGRKTQTRRVVNPQPNAGPNGMLVDLGSAFGLLDGCLAGEWKCPYGVVGDRLWCREAWYCPRHLGGSFQREKLVFRADETLPWRDYSAVVWKSPIHMPRAFSRLALEITNVRVERVQSISEADAIAEGVEPDDSDMRRWGPYKSSFAFLWQRINAKRGYGWNVNPLVWVVGFHATPDSATEARGEHAPSHPNEGPR